MGINSNRYPKSNVTIDIISNNFHNTLYIKSKNSGVNKELHYSYFFLNKIG